MPMKICWKGLPIGEVLAAGKTLEKAAFLSLRHVDRLRAYLLMVWPAGRSVRVLRQICQLPGSDIANYLHADIQAGVVCRTARGQYTAQPRVVQPS